MVRGIVVEVEHTNHMWPSRAEPKRARSHCASCMRAPRSDATVDPNQGASFNSFAGIQSSAAVCPPVGCNPPDMAVAASPNWVFQGVNTAFAVFDTHGNMQPGYPVFFGDFFGVPNPGACAGDLPFMSDPRAIYDPNDGRFIAAALEVEGAFGVNDCPFKTTYWIGVSQTNDPRGAWNVYAFDMSLGTTNAADFTQIGLDDKGDLLLRQHVQPGWHCVLVCGDLRREQGEDGGWAAGRGARLLQPDRDRPWRRVPGGYGPAGADPGSRGTRPWR